MRQWFGLSGPAMEETLHGPYLWMARTTLFRGLR
jgi:hypothetical protein